MTWLLNKLARFWDNSKHVWLWPFELLYNIVWWIAVAFIAVIGLGCLLVYMMFKKRP